MGPQARLRFYYRHVAQRSPAVARDFNFGVEVNDLISDQEFDPWPVEEEEEQPKRKPPFGRKEADHGKESDDPEIEGGRATEEDQEAGGEEEEPSEEEYAEDESSEEYPEDYGEEEPEGADPSGEEGEEEFEEDAPEGGEAEEEPDAPRGKARRVRITALGYWSGPRLYGDVLQLEAVVSRLAFGAALDIVLLPELVPAAGEIDPDWLVKRFPDYSVELAHVWPDFPRRQALSLVHCGRLEAEQLAWRAARLLAAADPSPLAQYLLHGAVRPALSKTARLPLQEREIRRQELRAKVEATEEHCDRLLVRGKGRLYLA